MAILSHTLVVSLEKHGVASSARPLACLALLASSFLFSACSGKTARAVEKRSEGLPVTVAAVVQKTMPVNIQVIGNVEAITTIAVKALIGGELTRVHFQEGDFVKKNDVLFTIDPRPLETQVSQAEANLARDGAQLEQAQANLARDIAQERYSRAQAARYSQLVKEGVISREQYDLVDSSAVAQAAAVRADRAAIESARASAKADKAALDNAKIQLGYTTICSPIDGRTGNLMVKQGNIVKASDIDLVTINQLQPIYVTFSVPESQLLAVKRYMAEGKLSVVASPEDSAADQETGVLTFVDNNVDMTTGTIKLKGTFTNSDRKLWPGQFVRVALRLFSETNAIVVPTRAVQTGQDGQFVFVVKPDMSVELRPVTPGVRVDQETVIQKGLAAGETVVTEGQLRLAPGAKVRILKGSDEKT
ncbi:MAG TPA: efflux RND transporter periplasmic adaptor subunit [Bryobacterales bacterium]|nr:efflux RND transporter periplasmic adaptor subunit [Bryobacterales bacterium]